MLDAGFSGCATSRKHTKECQLLKKSKSEKWITKAGEFSTDGQAKAPFTLDEHDPRRVVDWTVRTFKAEHSDNDQIGMTIGEDLTHELVTKACCQAGSAT